MNKDWRISLWERWTMGAGIGFCAGGTFGVGLYDTISGQGNILRGVFFLELGSILTLMLLVLPLIALRISRDNDSQGKGNSNKSHHNQGDANGEHNQLSRAVVCTKAKSMNAKPCENPADSKNSDKG